MIPEPDTAAPLFDTVVTVDWSARSTPSPARETADAVWLAVARRSEARVEVERPRYLRTRAEAVAALAALVGEERAAGRRLLAGFDFPLGYPAGTAGIVAGRAEALALWDWLAARIDDRPCNANNRFAVAAEINRLFPGPGPFWGRPASWPVEEVPVRKTGIVYAAAPERRTVERRVPSAKAVWQLMYAGSVGSQALLGIPALGRLRADPRLAGAIVWPLETGLAVPAGPVVLAEVYPSLLAPAIRAARGPGEILDAVQVRVTARRLAELDAAGALAALFVGPDGLTRAERERVEREEAWILGAGREDRLGRAA